MYKIVQAGAGLFIINNGVQSSIHMLRTGIIFQLRIKKKKKLYRYTLNWHRQINIQTLIARAISL